MVRKRGDVLVRNRTRSIERGRVLILPPKTRVHNCGVFWAWSTCSRTTEGESHEGKGILCDVTDTSDEQYTLA